VLDNERERFQASGNCDIIFVVPVSRLQLHDEGALAQILSIKGELVAFVYFHVSDYNLC
jgi:hypothetical protein